MSEDERAPHFRWRSPGRRRVVRDGDEQGVLVKRLALRERTVAAGIINHDFLFFSAVGEPLKTTYLPYNRWTEVLATLPVRFRKPYNARHAYMSWRLMIGHNRLLVAYEDGHSVATMERTYAAWTKGAKPEDVGISPSALARTAPAPWASTGRP
jgi:integrase